MCDWWGNRCDRPSAERGVTGGGSGKGVGTSEGWWVGGWGGGGAMFTVLVQPNCSRFLSTVTTHVKKKKEVKVHRKKVHFFPPSHYR